MIRARRLLAVVVTLAAAGVVGGVVAGARSSDSAARPQAPSAPSVPSPSPSSAPTSSSLPRVIAAPDHVRIDAIGVDADVIDVGTAADNSQEVPSSISDVGWWKDGRRPGQSGNAVVVGHTASRDDGVFDRLGDLRQGDIVTVSGGARDLTFRVTKIADVPVKDFGTVADDVYRASGPRGLVLMTCGDWNGTAFTSTVIVRATAA